MASRDSHSGAAETPRRDLPLVPGMPGRLASRLYSAAVKRRNARFDAGRAVITLDRPVISVGNLSLGGTGKTPMVERIVALLREHGRDPCIAMRGYGSRRNPGGRSDEADLYRARFEDLPIVAQPNRVEGLIKLFGTERGERVDCIVLDDGFQHRRIARQIDLVLVDAQHDIFESRVFPAGRMRERVVGLARATHIVITHSESISPDAMTEYRARLAWFAPCITPALCSHRWAGLTVSDQGAEREEPVGWLRGRRVVAACAIGRPASFLGAIERVGATTLESIVLPDHDPFSPRAVDRILRAAAPAPADAVVCTQKDWTKLRGRDIPWPCPVARPRLELEFSSGWDALACDILAAAVHEPA